KSALLNGTFQAKDEYRQDNHKGRRGRDQQSERQNIRAPFKPSIHKKAYVNQNRLPYGHIQDKRKKPPEKRIRGLSPNRRFQFGPSPSRFLDTQLFVNHWRNDQSACCSRQIKAAAPDSGDDGAKIRRLFCASLRSFEKKRASGRGRILPKDGDRGYNQPEKTEHRNRHH